MIIDFSKASWFSEPKAYQIEPHKVIITTNPQTDLWQRSYYGFRNDNAPCLLLQSAENFTFTTRVDFDYVKQFDQCGVVIYLDSENWFKASIEYETPTYSRLGSVVTNLGYSDWATSDIKLPSHIWYRLNRRGPDFLIESSYDGETFNQMRIFHLHKLEETTMEMATAVFPLPTKSSIQFGIYACSPLDSSFTASFSNMRLDPCQWLAHGS